eukprot:4361421-Prymnesium_polylepis.1
MIAFEAGAREDRCREQRELCTSHSRAGRTVSLCASSASEGHLAPLHAWVRTRGSANTEQSVVLGSRA